LSQIVIGEAGATCGRVLEQLRQPGGLHEFVDLRRLVAGVLCLGHAKVDFVGEGCAKAVYPVALISVGGVNRAISQRQLWNEAAFPETGPVIVREAEIDVVAAGKCIVDTGRVIVVVNAVDGVA